MKKTLLSVAFMFATIAGVNAQTISFEDSEGFILGNIDGQNGWGATQLPPNVNNPNFVITNSLASDGVNSFYVAGTNLQYNTSQGTTAMLGIFSDLMTITSPIFEISADIRMTTPTTVGNGSDMHFGAQSSDEGFLTSRVVFDSQGNIRTVDDTGTGPAYVTIGTYDYDTWYNVKVKYNFTAGTIEYLVNNTTIYTGSVWTTVTTVDQLTFLFDNYESGFYVDNIVISEGTASTEDFANAKFSVYPNPASDVINISYADTINAVTITDLNGRVVKQVLLGVNEGQINISDLSQGVYILNASANGKSVTEKIVKR